MTLLKKPTSKRTFSVAAPIRDSGIIFQLNSNLVIVKLDLSRCLKLILCHNSSKMMYICNCTVHVSQYIFFVYAISITVNCIHVFTLFPRLEHPAGWICARYKSLLLVLFWNSHLSPMLRLYWIYMKNTKGSIKYIACFQFTKSLTPVAHNWTKYLPNVKSLKTRIYDCFIIFIQVLCYINCLWLSYGCVVERECQEISAIFSYSKPSLGLTNHALTQAKYYSDGIY